MNVIILIICNFTDTIDETTMIFLVIFYRIVDAKGTRRRCAIDLTVCIINVVLMPRVA